MIGRDFDISVNEKRNTSLPSIRQLKSAVPSKNAVSAKYKT